MSKVRVSLSIKIGNFMMSDRLPKGIVPQIIQDIVAEITKVKMIVESEYHEDKEIIDSIPELNRDLVSFDTIRDYVKDDFNDELELDLDSILDKISSDGFDSLSDDEKEFLDKKSKGI
jgi:adenylate kinase family enzyme